MDHSKRRRIAMVQHIVIDKSMHTQCRDERGQVENAALNYVKQCLWTASWQPGLLASSPVPDRHWRLSLNASRKNGRLTLVLVGRSFGSASSSSDESDSGGFEGEVAGFSSSSSSTSSSESSDSSSESSAFRFLEVLGRLQKAVSER